MAYGHAHRREPDCRAHGGGGGPAHLILPYTVEYPNDYTMREALGFIAAAHGGNFIITDAGRLLLHTTAALPAETNFLVESETGGAILLGEVRLLV